MILQKEFTTILQLYLIERYFSVKQDDAYSELKAIRAGVPHGNVFGHYLFYINKTAQKKRLSYSKPQSWQNLNTYVLIQNK